jgi:hypothetical protein
VKRAYRRLAKANHPDAAGESALPRFLAIQSAYDRIAGPDGGAPAPGQASDAPTPRRPWSADPDRAGATRRAYGGRTRRDGRGPEAGTGARTPPPGAERGPGDPGGQPGDAAPQPTGKATLGSTSYDGAEREPFEPDWGGASWYGTTSGTYWTLNPKEYADPRKHGPEYQARARRQQSPAEGDADREPGEPRPTPTSTHTTASWWDPPADEPSRDGPVRAEPGAPTGGGGFAGPTRPPDRSPVLESTPDGGPVPSIDDVARSVGRWLDDERPSIAARIARGVAGWIPAALGIGWIAGEVTGCARFSAGCDPSVAPLSLLVQLGALLILLLVGPVARVAIVATLPTLLAVVPGAVLLLATSDPSAVAAGRTALGWLMALAWTGGLGYGLVREIRRAHRGPPPASATGEGRPVS